MTTLPDRVARYLFTRAAERRRRLIHLVLLLTLIALCLVLAVVV